MGRKSLGTLARFCAAQRKAFDLRAWFAERSVDRRDLAIAALYLSMTSWYGYEADLKRLAEELHPGIGNGSAFAEQMQAAQFDLARFSSTTRYWIHQPALEKTPEA
jgi:hypothetical protein